MAVDYTCRLPSPAAPVVDAQTGIVTEAMWRWMLGMFKRMGGNSPDSATALADLAAGMTAPAIPLLIGASPYVYIAPLRGTILVSGNGVIRLEISANTTYYPTGSHYGSFPLASGAQVRLTYTGSPVLTFIPG